MKKHHRALLLPWAGGKNALAYTNKVKAIESANLIAYWPLAEASGTTITDESGNGRNGAYTAVTLAQTGIGDGRTSASFDGSTSFGNIFTTSFRDAFNGNEGTLACWVKMSGSGVWTDGTNREFIRLLVNGSNLVLIDRSATNNGVRFSRTGGGTNKAVTDTSLAATLAFFHVAVTYSTGADEMKCYINGAQVGATQTGNGTFAGSLAATTTCIGAASTTPTNVHSGTLAHVAVWTTPLSAAQVLSLATVI